MELVLTSIRSHFLILTQDLINSDFDWKQDSAIAIANLILLKDPLLEIQPQLLTGS